MPTPPEKRIKKYESKVDADVIRARISAMKDAMIESATARMTELAEYQASAKALLDANGIAPELTIVFLKAVGKLYSLKLKHSGDVFKSEAKHYLDAQYNKFKTIFATTFPLASVLADIASLFGVEWSPPSGGSS